MKNENKKSKTLTGVVVSTKMDKTAVVSVDRFVKHPKYKKYYNISKKYKAHDENNQAVMGQKVTIVEVKPMSKDKRFKIVNP